MKKAFIQLHIAVFLAGFTGILGRLITLNEGLIVWWRLLISSVTMWILFLARRRIQKISTVDMAKIAGIGLVAALHWVSFYGAIKYANVSVALVCFSSVGFFTALFEPLLAKAPFKPVELLLGIFVMAGIYIIFHFLTEIQMIDIKTILQNNDYYRVQNIFLVFLTSISSGCAICMV